MTRVAFLVAIGVMAVLFWTAPAHPAQEDRTPDQGEQATSREQQKREFRKKLEAELDNLDRALAELKTRAEKASAEAKKQLDAAIKEFEQKRDATRQKLKELTAESAETWATLKSRLEATLEDLKKAYNRILDRFKE